jgi:hypothetical protein
MKTQIHVSPLCVCWRHFFLLSHCVKVFNAEGNFLAALSLFLFAAILFKFPFRWVLVFLESTIVACVLQLYPSFLVSCVF